MSGVHAIYENNKPYMFKLIDFNLVCTVYENWPGNDDGWPLLLMCDA